MKIAVVTGAFGFAGANLVEHLLQNEYKVYAVGRKKPTRESGALASEDKAGVRTHNDRFADISGDRLVRVCLEMEEYDKLPEYVPEKADVFFHLAWGGGRDDFDAQMKNVEGALKAIDSAARINPSIRFVGIGSQAEYGIKSDAELITEDMVLEPFTAYGSCKAAAYYLLRARAADLGIDFIWGRIFSLIGKYEPEGRMFPDLIRKLSEGEKIALSSCEQYWDYLDAGDCADAIIALGEKGISGESYNIANGDFKPLKDFVLEAADIVSEKCSDSGDSDRIAFGNRANPFVSLRPSATKIQKETGWKAKRTLKDSIDDYGIIN